MNLSRNMEVWSWQKCANTVLTIIMQFACLVVALLLSAGNAHAMMNWCDSNLSNTWPRSCVNESPPWFSSPQDWLDVVSLGSFCSGIGTAPSDCYIDFVNVPEFRPWDSLPASTLQQSRIHRYRFRRNDGGCVGWCFHDRTIVEYICRPGEARWDDSRKRCVAASCPEHQAWESPGVCVIPPVQPGANKDKPTTDC